MRQPHDLGYGFQSAYCKRCGQEWKMAVDAVGECGGHSQRHNEVLAQAREYAAKHGDPQRPKKWAEVMGRWLAGKTDEILGIDTPSGPDEPGIPPAAPEPEAEDLWACKKPKHNFPNQTITIECPQGALPHGAHLLTFEIGGTKEDIAEQIRMCLP